MLHLTDPVTKLHLVTAKALTALNKLGISTIKDLLFHFPRDWQDLSEIKTIREAKPNEKINLKVTLKTLKEQRTRWRRLHITEALLEDQTGSIVTVWFNQPFLKNVLQIGRQYYMNGKVVLSPYGGSPEGKQLQNPTFELAKENTIHTAGLIPVYELTEGVTAKQFRYWLKLSLESVNQLFDPLPFSLKDRLKFPKRAWAVKNLHFPASKASLELAYKRLAFDELFLFQLALKSYRLRLQSFSAPRFAFHTSLISAFVQSLPFKLTNSQRLTLWEILQDLSKPYPMNRLLEGEVGSGKTVVAGMAMLEVAKAGFQSIILAPTEILAWQHYETLKVLLKNTNLKIALLTRSHKIGELSDLASGKVKIIIGTHALLQEKVQFLRIGLLVVDEQHRFGVRQRAHLAREQKGLIPHLLSMSATPIPRTLALAFYGDLDISELKELPKGRKKVITRLVEPDKRPLAYEFIRKEIEKGRQVYVVAPLIEESDKLGVKAATREAEKLKKEIFPEFPIGLLHGRLKGEEKKQIMEKFKAGETQILVSTSVIEVGIDVPNATVMVIENAERFGLSQLHQLRGRVGRSHLQSYCLLFAEGMAEQTRERLEAVVESSSGFELAEKDLELRGQGEVMGIRQSGFIPFKIARLSDRKLVELAKKEAEGLLAQDPELTQSPPLKQRVEEIAKDAHLE